MTNNPASDNLKPNEKLLPCPLKLGDIVENEWASIKNPTKFLMFISKGKRIKCLAISGAIVVFDNDKDLRLKKVGELDLSNWNTRTNQSPEEGN